VDVLALQIGYRANQVAISTSISRKLEAVPGFRGYPGWCSPPGARSRRRAVEAAAEGPLVATRPLLGASAYLQVVAPEAVVLHADRPPLAPGDTCPGCGVTSIGRVAILEGDRPRPTRPASARGRGRSPSPRQAADLPALSVSTQPIDDLWRFTLARSTGRVSGFRRRARSCSVREGGTSLHPEALLAALWDGGATGLEFRPVVRTR
jgi:hypothetical protein